MTQFLMGNHIQVKHGLGNRLNSGQGQNKIGGAHLHQCMHNNLMKRHSFCWAPRKVVPISEDQGRKLDTTSGTGYMEVKAITK